eukprot:6475302-Amphidinium_carterae.1
MSNRYSAKYTCNVIVRNVWLCTLPNHSCVRRCNASKGLPLLALWLSRCTLKPQKGFQTVWSYQRCRRAIALLKPVFGTDHRSFRDNVSLCGNGWLPCTQSSRPPPSDVTPNVSHQP